MIAGHVADDDVRQCQVAKSLVETGKIKALAVTSADALAGVAERADS